jgi:hypothetical protein
VCGVLAAGTVGLGAACYGDGDLHYQGVAQCDPRITPQPDHGRNEHSEYCHDHRGEAD